MFKRFIVPTVRTPVGIKESPVYFRHHSSKPIKKVSVNGGVATTIWTLGGFSNLTDISLDVSNGKIYWTTLAPARVMRGNMDGTGKQETMVNFANV